MKVRKWELPLAIALILAAIAVAVILAVTGPVRSSVENDLRDKATSHLAEAGVKGVSVSEVDGHVIKLAGPAAEEGAARKALADKRDGKFGYYDVKYNAGGSSARIITAIGS
jgi:hypothetical protein